MQLYLTGIIFSQSFWNSKRLFMIEIITSYITFGCVGTIPPSRRGESNPLPRGEPFFTVSNFRKNTSKYAKLMVEPYICDNLNHNYRFFSFLPKKKKKINIVWKTMNWFSFRCLWLYNVDTEISCSFLKLSYFLYIVYRSQKGRDYPTIIWIIYIWNLLHRIKLCDGVILIVTFL